jgi:tRNA pseudouridine13 synthase
LDVVNRGVKDGKMRVALPLVGYGQHTSRGVQGEVERGILEEEGVELGGFRVDCLREMGSRGKLRAIICPVKSLVFGEVQGEDDGGSGCRVQLDFMLYRGSYATVVLREVMKSRRIVEAGF